MRVHAGPFEHYDGRTGHALYLYPQEVHTHRTRTTVYCPPSDDSIMHYKEFCGSRHASGLPTLLHWRRDNLTWQPQNSHGPISATAAAPGGTDSASVTAAIVAQTYCSALKFDWMEKSSSHAHEQLNILTQISHQRN